MELRSLRSLIATLRADESMSSLVELEIAPLRVIGESWEEFAEHQWVEDRALAVQVSQAFLHLADDLAGLVREHRAHVVPSDRALLPAGA